jgi:hypothetical protein
MEKQLYVTLLHLSTVKLTGKKEKVYKIGPRGNQLQRNINISIALSQQYKVTQ